MATAVSAILGDLNAFGVLTLIFRRAIVAATALRAFHIDNRLHLLLHNFRNNSGADGTTTFANREADFFFHGNWSNELNF